MWKKIEKQHGTVLEWDELGYRQCSGVRRHVARGYESGKIVEEKKGS